MGTTPFHEPILQKEDVNVDPSFKLENKYEQLSKIQDANERKQIIAGETSQIANHLAICRKDGTFALPKEFLEKNPDLKNAILYDELPKDLQKNFNLIKKNDSRVIYHRAAVMTETESQAVHSMVNQYLTCSLDLYLNNKEDCLKLLLNFSEKMNDLNSFEKKLVELNETWKKEFRLNNEVLNTFIKIASKELIDKQEYNLEDIVTLLQASLSKTYKEPQNNEKNFSDPVKERIFVEKLGRFLRVYRQIS